MRALVARVRTLPDNSIRPASQRPRPAKVAPVEHSDEISDLIVKEMSHRWFNALQVLDALIGQCMRSTASLEEIAPRLSDMRSRIAAMAALHRRIYEVPSSGAGIRDMCRALWADVAGTFGRSEVTARITMPPMELSRPRTLCFASLFVELVTNALKHGRVRRAVWCWCL